MSGIAAVFRSDGAMVEPQLLERLSQTLAIRGPDSKRIWSCGPFGLVHTHLATDARPSDQPFSSDGQIWVIADARIDARQDLIARLGLRGKVDEHSDAELIWHAYDTWGDACAEHLLGDFAFIIADLRRRRLVCARDQLGVKPLFHASRDGWVIVSNLLDCVRQCELVDTRLDDSFIAEFLLHSWNTEPSATVFREIRRLAPAHAMVCTQDGIRHRQYWTPTVPAENWDSPAEGHVERFLELFEQAVSDRLRNQPACITFSGGKDSTSIAAMASRLLAGHPFQPALHGVCAVFDRILPDQERHFATLAAQSLALPLDFVVCDDQPLFPADWDTPAGQTAEPSIRVNPVNHTVLAIAAQRSRIILSGEGGDEAIRAPSRYYQKLLEEGRWLRWLADFSRHLWTLRSVPPVGLRTLLYKRAWRRVTGQQSARPKFPTWIHPNLVQAHSLRDRWEKFWRPDESLAGSRTPPGYGTAARGLLADAMNALDVSSLGRGVEYRFPYLDLRVIEYLWSIPPIPLRFEKEILQRAFAGCLPSAVLRRRKQGLAGDPLLVRPLAVPVSWEVCTSRTPEIRDYVTANPAPGGRFEGLNSNEVQAALTVFELESWMHHKWRNPS